MPNDEYGDCNAVYTEDGFSGPRFEGVRDSMKTITLDSFGHNSIWDGACLLEWVSYIAGEPFSDHPQCVSDVLARYGRSLNDRLGDEARQRLLPFARRLIGTANDGRDDERIKIIENYLHITGHDTLPNIWGNAIASDAAFWAKDKSPDFAIELFERLIDA